MPARRQPALLPLAAGRSGCGYDGSRRAKSKTAYRGFRAETHPASRPSAARISNGHNGIRPCGTTKCRRSRSSGKPRDPETGLDNFGARYYSGVGNGQSDLGRFLTPDWSAQAEPVPYAELDNPQSLNLYSYALNNPVSAVDPDGHFVGAGQGTDGTDVTYAWQRMLAMNNPPPPRPGPAWREGKSFPCVCAAPNEGADSRFADRIKNALRLWIAGHPLLAGFLTRYMGQGEAEVAIRTGNIPNYGKDLASRPTHMTRDEPVDDSQTAQSKYELPEPPAYRATVPDGRVPNTRVPEYGPKTSGGGDQVVTDDPVPVTPDEIIPLEPAPVIIDPLP